MLARSALLAWLLVAPAARAATPAAPAAAPATRPAQDLRSELVGTWRGASTCVRFAGNEACRDEMVVYRFEASTGKPGAVALEAYKIVGGIPELMYQLDGFVRDAATGSWSAEYRNPKVHIVWSYQVRGGAMEGTCTSFADPKVVYRNVVAKRDPR